jgi:hypothetical protein
MKIIDFHVHCYPDEVWPKVDAAIVKAYGHPADSPGTVEGLLSSMKESGVSLSIIQPVANQSKHVDSVNKWVESVRDKNKELIFFGAMHPGIENPYEAVCNLAEKGFGGVKMQPNAGAYYPDTKECFEIYRGLEENDMVLLTHAGDELKPFTPLYAHPKNFVKVFETFPDLKVVLAHLGGYKTWDDLDVVLGYENVYYDTAMSCEIGDKEFTDLVERLGVDRILFGTDYPWYSPSKSIDYVKKIFGSDSDKVFYRNTEKLLGF